MAGPFDDQFRRYFGTSDLEALAPDALTADIEKMRVNLGLERALPRRFALWSLLYMFGVSPDLDIGFKDEADRQAAREFMDRPGRARLRGRPVTR